jgi:hypothetical protein
MSSSPQPATRRPAKILAVPGAVGADGQPAFRSGRSLRILVSTPSDSTTVRVIFEANRESKRPWRR